MEGEPVNPQDLLPYDDWYYVLAYLNCPLDIWHLAIAHPYFRLVLTSEPRLREKWAATKKYAVFGHALQYLPLSSVLSFRLSSRLAKCTADAHLKQRVVETRRSLRLDRYLDPARGQGDFDALLKTMRNLPIRSSLQLSVTCGRLPDNIGQYRTFFEAFGEHVVALRLEWPAGGQLALRPVQTSELVKSILDLAQNLQRFELMARGSNVDLTVARNSWGGEAGVEYFWRANPLPRQTSLENLTLVLPSGKRESLVYSQPTIEAFLEKYGHKLQELRLIPHCLPFLRPAGTPFLTKLGIGLSTPQELDGLKNYHAPLLQDIEVHVTGDSCTIFPIQLFDALATFTITLASVSVRSQCVAFGWIQQYLAEVEFPNVHHLSLEGLRGETGPTFELLDNFPGLKSLSIQLEQEAQFEQAGDVFRNPADERPLFSDSELPEKSHFYMSPIWVQLPQLENVRVVLDNGERTRTRDFTREVAEHHQRTEFGRASHF